MAERNFSNFDYEKVYGKLTDRVILHYIKTGKIQIKPEPSDEELDELIGPASLDFRLGPIVKRLDTSGLTHIDPRDSTLNKRWVTEDLSTKDGVYVIHPRDFIQGETMEWLTLPDDIVGHLNGRSSIARYGVQIHATAPRFDPGWDGKLVLELRNAGEIPFTLELGMKIAAMEFERVMVPAETPYNKRESSKYRGQPGPTGSKLHQDFEKP